MSNKESQSGKLAFLILAHNEEEIIGETVSSIVPLLSREDAFFVVADNCTDATAGQARKEGAKIFVRNTGTAEGKARALAWFFEEYYGVISNFHMVIILDADSKLGEGFCERIRKIPLNGNNAYQCFVQPVFEDSPVGKLAALSELIDQNLSDRFRATLGWPVRLRGTGMLIPPGILNEITPFLNTDVEDIALTLLLFARGVPIKRVEKALVLDKKPMTRAFATQQRARWYRGQWLSLWAYRKDILRVFLKGPSGWALLSSLFLRPKWLISLFLFILAAAFVGIPPVSAIFWFLLFLSAMYLLIGLLILPDRGGYLKALFYGPIFIWMWLQSFVLALRPSAWRRSR